MILVTGGAGFIGSCLQEALHARGEETIIADRLGSGEKWRNLAAHPPAAIVPPDQIDAFLAGRPKLTAIVHMGAISETTARDADLVWQTNVALSLRLWDWCAAHGVRFLYASSAATYGDGAQGFSDDPALLPRLRPLNLYGWSKHVFDQAVLAREARGQASPPQWAGLKFFNVYGPNEYHKGKMISVVKVKYDEIAAGGAPRLFRSLSAGIEDGAQARDFVHVDDAVAVLLWLLDHPQVSGIFNLGTGIARSYRDLAHAVCDAAGVPRRISFIDMPEELRGQYQDFTAADLTRLRAAGYTAPFLTLEEGIGRYVRDYLLSGTLYR